MRLTLYITGASPNSAKAISNLLALCEQYFTNTYHLSIIDVYQQEDEAITNQLMALPLLVKHPSLPKNGIVGNMSDTNKILAYLKIN